MLADADKNILIACRQFIKRLSLEHQDARRVLYDEQLALYLEELVRVFATQEGASEQEQMLAQLAALFYPMGYKVNRKQALQSLLPLVQHFFRQQNGSPVLLNGVSDVLEEVYQQKPKALAACLLSDALAALHFDTEEHQWASLRQLEFELLQGSTDRLMQAQLRLQELLSLRFATHAGRQHWQQTLAKQLLAQKKKLEKLLREKNNTKAVVSSNTPFQQMENGVPVRATQTFFRAVYRNHINLSAIADNKANIMISVNSILISVLITFLSYRNIAETQPMILLPVVIFLVVGLASLVFAVLSARPKVSTAKPKTDERVNIAFFGSFVQLPIDSYEDEMNEVLQDNNLLYSNMVRDLYQLGVVLDKKYKYLAVSYNIFMVGLIVTVFLFLLTLFVF